MSTHITAFEAERPLDRAEVKRAPSFLGRMFKGISAAREAQAKRYVQAHLNGLSDTRLADLGFSAGEIAEIRATGQIPASFWL